MEQANLFFQRFPGNKHETGLVMRIMKMGALKKLLENCSDALFRLRQLLPHSYPLGHPQKKCDSSSEKVDKNFSLETG